jgi:hypothetical protein
MSRLPAGFAAAAACAATLLAGCGGAPGTGRTRPADPTVSAVSSPESSRTVVPSMTLPATVTARPGPGGGTPATTAAPASTPAEVTLAPGQTARLAGGRLTVRFVEVRGDSRCPVAGHIACAWEGDATVALSISGPRTPMSGRELHANQRFATAATVAGYEVRLVRLGPERRTTDAVPAGDYRATLRVSAR